MQPAQRGRARGRGRGAVREKPQQQQGNPQASEGPRGEPQPSPVPESAVPWKGGAEASRGGTRGYGRGRLVAGLAAPQAQEGPSDEPQPSPVPESAVPWKGGAEASRGGTRGFGRGRLVVELAAPQAQEGPRGEPQPSPVPEPAVPWKGGAEASRGGARGNRRGRLVVGLAAPQAQEGPSDEPKPSTSVGAGAIVPWKGGAEAAGSGGAVPGKAMVTRKVRGNMRGLEEVVVTREPNARSKQGTLGTKLMLQTNYFRLERKEQHVIFQHHVHIEPPVDDVRLRHALFKTQAPLFGPYIFDGMQLFLYNKLRSDELELQVKDPRSDALYKMCIRRVGTVTMASEKALQMLNLMQRQAMASLKLLQLNRNFFDPSQKISVPQYGLELYPGYITSIRQHEHDILLGVQITHRVLRTETVYRMYQNMVSRAGGAERHEAFKKALIGTVVMTVYNQKTYTVSDVDFNVTPLSRFNKSDGTSVTFMEYFCKTYNVRIADPHQPMLVSVPNKRRQRQGMTGMLLLVPELCRLTGISEEMRKDHRLMCAIANHTRLNVDQRMKRLERFNERLVNEPESHEVLSYWQTELDRRLMDVPARVLAPECLFFGRRDNAVQAGPTADWSAACRTNGMFKTEPLMNWCVICPDADMMNLRDFLTTLTAVARSLGFAIAPPLIVRASATGSAYFETLRSVLNRDPQLILCVVPNDKPDRYRMIKKVCCIDRAIPTQVLRSRTITPRADSSNHVRSVATKVAIQLNCKLGGIPWMVKNPLSSVMVVGYDVCHDTSEADRSYGALVATMYGERATPEPHFFSCVERHAGGIELSSFISTGIMKAIRAYQAEFGHDQLPRRIFFYRDGVGDGQLGHVVKHEVNAIRERLQAASPDRLKLTFIVVTKRIGTRLFHGGKNPPPGTVVDDKITLPERTDFFLVSQSVRHGTVSPTSYNIIHDESGLTVDQLQAYTAKQTHLYYNWTGTVSVPAVCQYAHKLAGLVGQHLHQAPNQRLDRNLYFL